MTIIKAQVPDFVLEQAHTLADCAGIPVEPIVSLAVIQSVGVWSHQSHVAHRANQASREAFERALAEVPDAPPMPRDKEMPR